LILSQPEAIQGNVPIFRNYCVTDKGDLEKLLAANFGSKAPRQTKLIVTMATPNSGAMLDAQINVIAKLLKTPFSMHKSSIKDLTTDRLFRLMQYFSVDTPVLSISGSGWNRFGKAPSGFMLWFGRLAGRLHLPNDMIVEDRSVDLVQSILPNEFVSGPEAKYLHVCRYVDCTDVIHTNIYDHWKVREIVVDCMTRIP
jgi:hypothetical protein